MQTSAGASFVSETALYGRSQGRRTFVVVCATTEGCLPPWRTASRWSRVRRPLTGEALREGGGSRARVRRQSGEQEKSPIDNCPVYPRDSRRRRSA